MFFLFFLTCAQEPKLISEEIFDGIALNGKVWNFELGDVCLNLYGWDNNER